MIYRKDIDGLRAFSIFFVVLFHSDLNFINGLFSGGFIGVDIFFVISGYLITGILIDYHTKKKCISNFERFCYQKIP
ncbi:MAG: acyltransferase [Pelagibacteraceae bacterium]|nr:acyltransferase [Pelagibacteraceae bacterium]